MSKKQHSILIQTGISSDGKIVLDGLWAMYQTHGLPLDIIFLACLDRGWIPDWIKLYQHMLNSGMEHTRILSKLEEAILDSFGKEFCDVVISKLEQIFNKEHK